MKVIDFINQENIGEKPVTIGSTQKPSYSFRNGNILQKAFINLLFLASVHENYFEAKLTSQIKYYYSYLSGQRKSYSLRVTPGHSNYHAFPNLGFSESKNLTVSIMSWLCCRSLVLQLRTCKHFRNKTKHIVLALPLIIVNELQNNISPSHLFAHDTHGK